MSDTYQQSGNADALTTALHRLADREMLIGQLEGKVMVSRRVLEMIANPLLEPDVEVIRAEAREALKFLANFDAAPQTQRVQSSNVLAKDMSADG